MSNNNCLKAIKKSRYNIEIRPIWLRIVNDVRTIIQRQSSWVCIPDLTLSAGQ